MLVKDCNSERRIPVNSATNTLVLSSGVSLLNAVLNMLIWCFSNLASLALLLVGAMPVRLARLVVGLGSDSQFHTAETYLASNRALEARLSAMSLR
jgi:hypothetical protein